MENDSAKDPSQLATTMASHCWCDEETENIEMDVRLANAFAKRLDAMLDGIEAAWGIIANARNWVADNVEGKLEWIDAAMRWRDEFWHPLLDGFWKPGSQDAADAQAVADTADEPDIPWEDVGEDDLGVGIQFAGVDDNNHEMKLEISLGGKTGTCFISHLFFESLKDHWEEATFEAYGLGYKECLLEDLDRFNEGLPKDSPPMAFNQTPDHCTVPPAGWVCTRGDGHEGPCAAYEVPPPGPAPAEIMHNQAREIVVLRKKLADLGVPEEDRKPPYTKPEVLQALDVVPRWVAMTLFAALDDIDTADDLAKGDEGLYRNLVRRYHKERFKVADTDGYKVRFQCATEPPNNVDFTGTFKPGPGYVKRLHNLVAAMVTDLQQQHPESLTAFDQAWLSTFDDPDSFPEVTKIVNADKS